MKKLLVLSMVLGMVATANAGLITISPDGSTNLAIGGTLTIAVMSATNADSGLLLELDDSAYDAANENAVYSTAVGDWSGNVTTFAAAGGSATVIANDMGYQGLFSLSAASNPSTSKFVTTGEWFSINYTCAGPGDMYITLYDSQAKVLDQLVVHQTPEPFTMGLLGLGGLFLRRRK